MQKHLENFVYILVAIIACFQCVSLMFFGWPINFNVIFFMISSNNKGKLPANNQSLSRTLLILL